MVFFGEVPLTDKFINIAEMSKEDIGSVVLFSQSQEGREDFESEVIGISEAIEELTK